MFTNLLAINVLPLWTLRTLPTLPTLRFQICAIESIELSFRERAKCYEQVTRLREFPPALLERCPMNISPSNPHSSHVDCLRGRLFRKPPEDTNDVDGNGNHLRVLWRTVDGHSYQNIHLTHLCSIIFGRHLNIRPLSELTQCVLTQLVTRQSTSPWCYTHSMAMWTNYFTYLPRIWTKRRKSHIQW